MPSDILGGVVLDLEVQLRGELAERLISHAAERKMRPVELIADLVNTILRDDLVAAVLDID